MIGSFKAIGVAEIFQPDSLTSSANVSSKERNQPTPVQQGANELNLTEATPIALNEPIRSDAVTVSSSADEAAKLEPSPVTPEDETINLPE